MPRVLVVFAHPAFHKSRLHREMVGAIRGLPDLTFHDLYELYPDFDIDVDREQRLLVDHDVVVLQHPFYWYSCPALLKEWIDLVFAFGWAYGPGGTRLEGKLLVTATTTGGSVASYSAEGHNHYPFRQFLLPFEQTARLCGMTYLPPFVVHGTVRLTDTSKIASVAEQYRAVIERLRDSSASATSWHRLERLNDLISA